MLLRCLDVVVVVIVQCTKHIIFFDAETFRSVFIVIIVNIHMHKRKKAYVFVERECLSLCACVCVLLVRVSASVLDLIRKSNTEF